MFKTNKQNKHKQKTNTAIVHINHGSPACLISFTDGGKPATPYLLHFRKAGKLRDARSKITAINSAAAFLAAPSRRLPASRAAASLQLQGAQGARAGWRSLPVLPSSPALKGATQQLKKCNEQTKKNKNQKASVQGLPFRSRACHHCRRTASGGCCPRGKEQP